ncbi:hypothetical protein M8818_006982 [Zalaria obscura]|uniref:Uncharacterized protein n=1 Tax=Zalaria obscura TaxID=2024903 RepID=A0ACC3S4H4_9PEZI
MPVFLAGHRSSSCSRDSRGTSAWDAFTTGEFQSEEEKGLTGYQDINDTQMPIFPTSTRPSSYIQDSHRLLERLPLSGNPRTPLRMLIRLRAPKKSRGCPAEMPSNTGQWERDRSAKSPANIHPSLRSKGQSGSQG